METATLTTQATTQAAPATITQPYRIATDYRSHPTTGAGQIKARTHGPIRPRTLTRAYDHGLSRFENHRAAAVALAQKISADNIVPTDPHSANPHGGIGYDWTVTRPIKPTPEGDGFRLTAGGDDHGTGPSVDCTPSETESNRA